MLLLIYGFHPLAARQILRVLFIKHRRKANTVLNYVAVAKRTSKQEKISGERKPGSGT
jgi:hypothetical protein